MKNSGIYKITSPSGKIYIGQSSNLKQRIKDYEKTIHCKGQKRLYHSLIKYGFNNHQFEVIEYCSFSSLNERERFWQDYFNVLGEKGLNCKLQSTETKKLVLSKEARKKISNHMLKNNPMFLQENKNITSQRFKGEGNPMFGRKGSRNPTSKKIICSKSGKVFDSISEASDYIKIKYSTLRSMINGTNKNKTTLKYL